MSDENRRRFLQFLAASPLAYASGAFPQTLVPGSREADPRMWAPYDPTHLIKDPKERGAPVWYQLYATNKWDVAKGMVMRAEKAGSPVLAVTVDRSGGRNQETLFRLMRTDTRNCDGCHDRSSLQANMRRRSMYE